ncbi:MAG: pyridoxamine 5'-phosphate oxidase family protein [Euryarchaeota archaeon]
MNFDECKRFAEEHAICSLATVDGDQPRVRMVGMWFVDKVGFYFSTANVKEVYRQLRGNAKVELCFYAPPARPLGEEGAMDMGKVMRASGTVAFLDDPKLKERLLAERPFLRPNAENLVLFRVEKGEAWFWTFADSGRESAIERTRF